MSEEEIVKGNTTPEDTQAAVMEKMLKKTEAAVKKQNKVLEKLKVVYAGIDTLKPNAYNPNRQTDKDFALLCRSMQEDGFTQPILALINGVIIDGEHRWRAARSLGYTEVPVVFTDMSAEQMRISTLRHNRARGSEDVELTSSMVKDLEKLGALEYVKSELGVSSDEINLLLTDVSAPDALGAEEFSQAWLPKSAMECAEEVDSKVQEGEGFTFQSAMGMPVVKSFTRDAARAVVDLDTAMEGAKNEEERKELRKVFDVFRLALSFSGEEAALVQKVLGKKAAEKLVDICRPRYEAMIAAGLIDVESGKVIKIRPVKSGAPLDMELVAMGVIKSPITKKWDESRQGVDRDTPESGHAKVAEHEAKKGGNGE